MATEVSICALALSHLRNDSAVVSISSPNTIEEEYCQKFYPMARDFTLADHPWGFATRHTILALKGTAPADWTYQYGVPAGYLAAQRVYPASSGDLPQPFEEGSIDTDGDEVVIWTDLETAYLKYTAKITNPTVFSPAYTMALSWMLAYMLAGPIATDRSVQNAMLEGYGLAMSKAAIADAKNQKLTTSALTQRTYSPGKIAART